MKTDDATLGQATVLGAGGLMLFLGIRACIESVDAGALVFRVRSLSVVDGSLAGLLIAVCLFVGSYLVMSALKRMRA